MEHLSELVKEREHTKKISIKDRVPHFLIPPCDLQVTYHAETESDFYLLYLITKGNLRAICQRCMQEFSLFYSNETTLAVCSNEERAGQLLEQYECIVSANRQVDLNELITDELHLYAGQFHPNEEDCDKDVLEFLTPITRDKVIKKRP